MSTNAKKGVTYMLATILKVCGGIIVALTALMTYSLMKAASMADEAESFDEWYQRTNGKS
jgi:hypothetical protein